MSEELSRQRILLLFDRLGDVEPLPLELVAAELGVDEAVARERLDDLTDAGALTHAVTDDGEDYWWAELAPRLSEELEAELDREGV